MTDINIGLVGFGTVGQALYQVIALSRNAHASISKICVRSLGKPRAVDVPADMLTMRRPPMLLSLPRCATARMW